MADTPDENSTANSTDNTGNAEKQNAEKQNADRESSGAGHEEARRNNMARIVELGHDPWGSRFDDRSLMGDVRQRASEIQFQVEGGEAIALPDFDAGEIDYRQWKTDNGPGAETGPTVRVAGRIMLQRTAGKLIFLNIEDWTGGVQIFMGRKQVGDDNWELAKCFDLGDLVGVDGRLGRTNTGELTVFAAGLHFLGKAIEPPPDKHAGLVDVELRQRRRYLDLSYTAGVRERFLDRTKIVASIRNTLNLQGFCEVEGPTLHAIAGGAAAKPFITNHNALGLELYLRIALELHLKRLLVGGMERVYEMGRVYRNEGIDTRHNPEFTMLEVYQAFGNYESMMDLTEAMITDAIQAIGAPNILPWGDAEIDFTPPFQRRTYNELFEEQTGVNPADDDAVIKLAGSLHIKVEGRHLDVVRNDIFEEKVEDALVGPIFVMDYPASICPLTKRKADNPAIAERFELFVHGMEVANAYTELNDPDLQEKLFKTQLAGLSDEDSMAKMDHDFVRALRNGMPPAGGLGVGIDRLVMLLTNSKSIRDVVLFPLLRPEA
jgi:lysyl-tRNA synthetase class 2